MYNKMNTIRIRPEVRKIWAEKTFELTNIGAGAALFGQIISGNTFSLHIFVLGLILVFTGYVMSYILYR